MNLTYGPGANSGRRLTGIGTVIVIHLLVVYALVSGLARKAVDIVRGPLETKLIEEVKLPEPPPKKELPPPPKAEVPPPPAYVPPPLVTPTVAPTNTITAVTRDEPPPAPAPTVVAPPPPAPPPPVEAPKPPPVRVAAEVDLKNCAKPDYPAASRRQEEEGRVVLRLLVGPDGRVNEARVDSSSGYPRLDEAARAGWTRCQFKPATVDGKPEQQWVTKTTIWKLEIND